MRTLSLVLFPCQSARGRILHLHHSMPFIPAAATALVYAGTGTPAGELAERLIERERERVLSIPWLGRYIRHYDDAWCHSAAVRPSALSSRYQGRI